MDNSTLSPDENSTEKESCIPLAALKSRENFAEIDELKGRIKRLEETIKIKDDFIRDIGESKDDDAREFDKEKMRLLSEIEQLNVKVSKRICEIEAISTELDSERLRCRKLEDDLRSMEEKFRAERLSDANQSLSDSASFSEGKEKALQAKLSATEKDLRLCIDHNTELLERMEQMESVYEETCREMEGLRELNSSLRTELAASKEHALELESELHALRVNPEMAKQGNSLFGEVIEGREKQEQEMAILFREKERFRIAYDKAMKMLHENAMKAEQNCWKRDALSGPTLDVFKKMKKKLKYTQHENERLKERVMNLESDLLNIELQNLNGNSEARIRNQIMQDDLRCKKRLEMQIHQLQTDNHELLDKIAAESSRAAAVPSLEHRIETLQKIIAQLEKDRRFSDNCIDIKT